jgi:hypothetical protein
MITTTRFMPAMLLLAAFTVLGPANMQAGIICSNVSLAGLEVNGAPCSNLDFTLSFVQSGSNGATPDSGINVTVTSTGGIV